MDSSDLIATASHVADNPEWLKEPLPYLLGGFAESLTPAVLAGSIASMSATPPAGPLSSRSHRAAVTAAAIVASGNCKRLARCVCASQP